MAAIEGAVRASSKWVPALYATGPRLTPHSKTEDTLHADGLDIFRPVSVRGARADCVLSADKEVGLSSAV
jgi:hypothetical protein